MNCLLRACVPTQLLRQGLETGVDTDTMKKLTEYIEVWNTYDRMLLLDLNQTMPAPKLELADTEKFTDVNSYVDTGFRPAYRKAGEFSAIFLEETRLGNMFTCTAI